MEPRFVLKNKRTTFERIEKFISPVYFTDCNLFGRLNAKSCGLKSLKTFASETIITYEEAIKQKFSDTTVGKCFGPTWSTHWFKLEIEIPYEWAGREVRLVWDSESEALIWMDGHPVQGLSAELKRIYFVLTKHFDPIKESRFTLYVEMACNEVFGAGDGGFIRPPKPDKYFTLKRAEVVIFDKKVHDLLLDFEVLIDMIKSLPEESHRLYNALYLGNNMINIISEGGDRSYEEAHELALKFFNEKNGSSQFNLFAIGHCHIDTAWLWPYRETKRKCARSFSSVLQLMDDFPDFIFACSQAQQYEWMKEHYPQLYERMKIKIKEGKFLPVGGTWVEMDCNIPSGESLVRQFLIGHKFFKKEFGIKCNEFWLPDTFGYSGQLPQIMKLCGMERFVTQKMSWNLVNKFPHHMFWWHGIDDSRVLAHFPPGDSYSMACDPSELLKSAKNFQDKGRSDCSLFVFGHGDGGQGPTEDMLQKLERMKDVDGLPRVTCSNLDKFFTRVEEQDSKNGMLCSWRGELFLELHNATYTTHASVKSGNSACEVLLRMVELFASLKSVVHGRLKEEKEHEEIERLWKLLLLNQFHDVLPGTSINMVYKDVSNHYSDILKSGSNLATKLSEELFGKSEVEHGNFIVFNTMSWSRRECFEVPVCKSASLEPFNSVSQRIRNGNYLVPVNVPSIGYNGINSNENFSPFEKCFVEKIGGEKFIMKNGLVTAVFDNGGHLLELYVAKETRNAIRSGCHGNQLLLFDDIPLYWDAWDVMDYHLETLQLQNDVISKTEIIENGPLRVALEVSHKIGKNSHLKQMIILDACSPYIRFHNRVDWFESHKFLKVEFPLNVLTRRATYGIQFGHLERSTHFNTSWDSAQFEVCGHKWADCSEYDFGVAVLNDSKYGWSCIDNSLRLSLLRSSKSPDETADMGSHEFTYAIMPHKGSFQSAGVIQACYNLNNPLLLLSNNSHSSKSFITISCPSIILEAFKMSEEDSNKCIARFYEAFGGTTTTEVTFNFEVKDIKCCNLLEEESNEIIKKKDKSANRIDLTFKPFQILTISITFA